MSDLNAWLAREYRSGLTRPTGLIDEEGFEETELLKPINDDLPIYQVGLYEPEYVLLYCQYDIDEDGLGSGAGVPKGWKLAKDAKSWRVQGSVGGDLAPSWKGGRGVRSCFAVNVIREAEEI